MARSVIREAHRVGTGGWPFFALPRLIVGIDIGRVQRDGLAVIRDGIGGAAEGHSSRCRDCCRLRQGSGSAMAWL